MKDSFLKDLMTHNGLNFINNETIYIIILVSSIQEISILH